MPGTDHPQRFSRAPTCAYYEIEFADVARFIEDDGPLPTGHRCNSVAAAFDQLMRGWLCETHAAANQCLRSVMPPEVAEFASLLANADLDDDALDAILAAGLDENASRLESFLQGAE